MVQPLSYEVLKNIVANDGTAQDNIEDIKYMFRNDIGSARNMYRIHTVADLIDCLERHDALSEFDIEPFREIADHYGGQLANIITSYNFSKALQPVELFNQYREIQLAHECATRLQISDLRNGFHSGLNANSPVLNCSQPVTNNAKTKPCEQILTKEKRAAIYKLIASEIGTAWRCLGRELEIRQGAMDDIEIQYRDLNTRVYKIFQAFEEDDSVDAKDHFQKISRALDECRRKDLRRKLEAILSK